MLLWNNLLSVLNALVYSVENLEGFENGLLDDASIINTTIVGESRVHQHNQGTEEKNEKDGISRKIRYRKGTIGEKKGSNQEKNTKIREIGEFENRISNNVSIEDNFEILEPMSSEMINLNFEPQPSILHFHDFGFDALGCYLSVNLLSGDIDEENEQNLRNYYYDIDLEQLIYCSNRKFCHLHYRWDDVKAMRQRRREAGLDVENYTIQDVMRMSRRSASDSPIDDDMSPYPINEN